MDLRQEARYEVISKLRGAYLAGRRKEKTRIVEEAARLTGYHRRYAQQLLRDGLPCGGRRRGRGGRPRVYTDSAYAAVLTAAEATGWLCGKRLVAALPDLLPALEHEGAIALDAHQRTAALAMSAATVDRYLRAYRRAHRPRGACTTRPGRLLKAQIPIHTYTPWEDQRVGFAEIDLLAHCGESTAGEYLQTLTVTDIASGWTECVALLNKSQQTVVAALAAVRAHCPFPLLGIDSDNGSEFLNAHLLRYTHEHQLTFTRCRPYRKNDQAHVEQKNGQVVRSTIGYDRYEGAASARLLNAIYALLRVQINGYLPVMKLIGKERIGARVRKHYDRPQTPFQRVRASGALDPEQAAAFEAQLDAIGPLTLRRRVDRLVAQLWQSRIRASSRTTPAADKEQIQL